jgi:hypothetical protein
VKRSVSGFIRRRQTRIARGVLDQHQETIMATTDLYRRTDNSLSGLFNSMMGFTYASTLYTVRMMFTSPTEFVDRLRVSLDKVSNALTDSVRSKDPFEQSRTAREILRDDVDAVPRTAARAVEDLPAGVYNSENSEILSGRKR